MAKRKKKLTYEEVYSLLSEYNVTLLETSYINDRTKMNMRDSLGYMYYSDLHHITRTSAFSPRMFDPRNPYTIQNIKLWLEINNKSLKLLSDKYTNNSSMLEWECLVEDCRATFIASWSNVQSKSGCPYCAGQKVGISNCLSTKMPELAKEWHQSKNGNLTSLDVTLNTDRIVWWQCSGKSSHEWKASVSNRVNRGSGCPFCSSNPKPSKECNLLVIYPSLCVEWDYNKNKKLPSKYTPYTTKKVWWICNQCQNEWYASIGNRTRNCQGCPECHRQSKGERKISESLKNRNISFIFEKSYKGLYGMGGGLLSYDFYLPDYDLLIEYQGEQHEYYVERFHQTKKDFETQQEHDRRKRTYAQNNNIKLLEIWYYDFDNIETILTDYLNECNKEEGDVAI